MLRTCAKRFIVVTLLAALFQSAIVSAFSQTPGYGLKPDQWTPYSAGPHFDRVMNIIKTYRLQGNKISRLTFRSVEDSIGSVELVRIARDENCDEKNCFFVLFPPSPESFPLITQCQFIRAGFAHLHNPDGSNFFGFQFSCNGTLLDVQVTRTQYWVNPSKGNF